MKHRIGRVETQIQREVDDILLKDVNDPRVKGVTITGVKLTGDLQHATIFYSILDDAPDKVEAAQTGLDKASGLIRREVGSVSGYSKYRKSSLLKTNPFNTAHALIN